jgi:hypothetical protein
MGWLDLILGLVELVLVPATLLGLAMAIFKRRPRLLRRVSVLSVVVGLTVAQPFGVIASKQHGLPRTSTVRVKPTAVHVIAVGGLPLAPFRLYPGGTLSGILKENAPTSTLRARSWLWLPVLTNATTITGMCGTDDTRPCWDPDDPAHRNTLILMRAGHTYWVTIARSLGESGRIVVDPRADTWKLGFGVASPIGLAYWIAVLALFLLARWRGATAPGVPPSTPMTTTTK